MTWTIRIKRQKNPDARASWQMFEYEGKEAISIATLLHELNARNPLTDMSGNICEPVAWECSCMMRKCGACAMRINGLPRLACSAFLNEYKKSVITLEPLSRFPIVRDLIVDRTVIFEYLKKTEMWLKSEAYMLGYTGELRYQSARCLMCGCCLEICPNFSADRDYAGAVIPINAYRFLDEEQDPSHKQNLSAAYKKLYYEGCGKSFACQNICPIGIPIEELTVRSNAAAIWKKL